MNDTDAREAAHHLVAHSLALDHIDCHPSECEFVGVIYTEECNEFDVTASRIVEILDAHGWLRRTARPKFDDTLYPPEGHTRSDRG